MKNWEKFEQQASEYISSIINNHDFKVIKAGGSDSSSNDINVLYKGSPSFSLEAKLSPSQCGQFVLIESPDGKLALSDKMVYNNKFTIEIIKRIDNSKLNTSSLVNLDVEQSLLVDWVKFHYHTKKVMFLITSNSLNTFHAIIPIKDLANYFDFRCVLRKKRSGTRGVAKRDRENALTLLNKHLKKISLNHLAILDEDSGIYILNPTKEGLKKNELYFDKYFISNSDPKKYEVKVRANTNNLNVIFSLQYKGPFVDCGIKEFLEYIKNINI